MVLEAALNELSDILFFAFVELLQLVSGPFEVHFERGYLC
jgi:hypothetical protein